MESKPVLMDFEHSSIPTLGSELANETGRKVLTSLSRGPKSVSQIAAELGMPMNTVLFHIQKLVGAHIAELIEETAGKRGRRKIYALSSSAFVIIASQDQERALEKLRDWLERATRSVWLAVRPLIPVSVVAVLLAWGWTRFVPVVIPGRDVFGEAAPPAPLAPPNLSSSKDILDLVARDMLPWAIVLSLTSALLAFLVILIMRRLSRD